MAEEKSPSHKSTPGHSSRPSTEDGIPVPLAPAEQEPNEFTWRSISVLAGTALSYFITVGFANAFGVFQQYYVAHLLPDKSNFQIAWIGSFATFMLFTFAAPIGLIADRIGPTILITIGLICELISIFMLSLCKKYYQVFLAQGVLLGLSWSLIALPATAIPPLYFKKNRALSQGMTIGGSSLGGVIWPIVMDQFLNKHKLGFGWSIRIVGFMIMPIAAFIVITVRRPPQVPTPSEKSTAAGEEGTAPAPKPKKDFSVLRSRTAVFLFLGLAFAFFGFFSPLYFVTTYAVSLGMTEGFAFYLVSIANAASFFGRILPGFFADRYFGLYNALILSCVSSGIIAFCWTTATGTAGVVVWILFYGFASGAIMSLQVVCASTLVPRDMVGAAIGVAMSSVSLTGLFGSPISGELEKRGYLALSCWSGACLLAGGACVAVARFSKEKKLMAKV